MSVDKEIDKILHQLENGDQDDESESRSVVLDSIQKDIERLEKKKRDRERERDRIRAEADEKRRKRSEESASSSSSPSPSPSPAHARSYSARIRYEGERRRRLRTPDLFYEMRRYRGRRSDSGDRRGGRGRTRRYREVASRSRSRSRTRSRGRAGSRHRDRGRSRSRSRRRSRSRGRTAKISLRKDIFGDLSAIAGTPPAPPPPFCGPTTPMMAPMQYPNFPVQYPSWAPPPPGAEMDFYAYAAPSYPVPYSVPIPPPAPVPPPAPTRCLAEIPVTSADATAAVDRMTYVIEKCNGALRLLSEFRVPNVLFGDPDRFRDGSVPGPTEVDLSDGLVDNDALQYVACALRLNPFAIRNAAGVSRSVAVGTGPAVCERCHLTENRPRTSRWTRTNFINSKSVHAQVNTEELATTKLFSGGVSETGPSNAKSLMHMTAAEILIASERQPPFRDFDPSAVPSRGLLPTPPPSECVRTDLPRMIPPGMPTNRTRPRFRPDVANSRKDLTNATIQSGPMVKRVSNEIPLSMLLSNLCKKSVND